MKVNELSDAGVENIIYATINSAITDWVRSAAYLYREVGGNPLKVNRGFEDRFRCNKRIMSKIKTLKDAESFFKGETYEFYSKTIGCYFDPETILRRLNDRALEAALK